MGTRPRPASGEELRIQRCKLEKKGRRRRFQVQKVGKRMVDLSDMLPLPFGGKQTYLRSKLAGNGFSLNTKFIDPRDRPMKMLARAKATRRVLSQEEKRTRETQMWAKIEGDSPSHNLHLHDRRNREDKAAADQYCTTTTQQKQHQHTTTTTATTPQRIQHPTLRPLRP